MTFFNDGDHVVLVALPIWRLPTYSGTGEEDVSGEEEEQPCSEEIPTRRLVRTTATAAHHQGH